MHNQVNPKVSVLMPVYNGEKYLKDAINSILSQTFEDFEFLIINDGSTDSSETIINSYNDPRIRYIKNLTNLKIVATLNRGIDLARGEYLVRMDSDDISLPNRLSIQVEYMDTHPDVGVCGCDYKVFGEGIKSYVVNLPHSDKGIRSMMLLRNPLGHPNVIIRKSVLTTNKISYDEDFYRMEDWGLWASLMPYCKFSNINKVLFRYRWVSTSESRINSKDEKHLAFRCNLVSLILKNQGISLSGDEARVISMITSNDHIVRMTDKELVYGLTLLFNYAEKTNCKLNICKYLIKHILRKPSYASAILKAYITILNS